jgi:hyperosmotically inducible protein
MKRMMLTIACALALTGGLIASAVAAPQDTAAASGSTTLENRIERRIHRDSSLKSRDVKVSVSGDIVTLTGTVGTATQRARAARLARVKGVARVDNQIVVDESAIGKAAAKTKAATNKAIAKTKEGTERAVDTTKAGVEQGAEKSKEGAATAAEKTGQGVQKAGNELADAFILASVKTRLFGNAVLKGSDINVDCDAHVVTLKGTVPTEAARAEAIALAQKTTGVNRVVDRLTIGPKK